LALSRFLKAAFGTEAAGIGLTALSIGLFQKYEKAPRGRAHGLKLCSMGNISHLYRNLWAAKVNTASTCRLIEACLGISKLECELVWIKI